MNLADYYRVLGLRMGADFEAVKSAYRVLARRYHPDVNPDDQQAKDKFIQVTQAYRAIAAQLPVAANLQSLEAEAMAQAVPSGDHPHPQPPKAPASPQVQLNPKLSAVDQQLKQHSYEQLQVLFQKQRFPRAIALVEGLAQRMPQDGEVRQWQAITYQRWGRYLIDRGQWQKAQPYLKKALRTDPQNKSLLQEIRQDFLQLESLRAQQATPKTTR